MSLKKQPSRRAKRDATGHSLYPKSDEIPTGYVRIISGLILASDLVWDCMGREFIRADDECWLTPCNEAEFCIYVLRHPKDVKPKGGGKNYTIRRDAYR